MGVVSCRIECINVYWFVTFALRLVEVPGYYILRWANGEEGTKPAEAGSAIGDSLNRMTGGRLGGLMEGAREENMKRDIKGFDDEHTKPDRQPNGSAQVDSSTKLTDASNRVEKRANDVAAATNNATASATKPAANAVNAASTAKGVVSGGTGVGG